MKTMKKLFGIFAVSFTLVLAAAPIRSEAAAPKLNKKTASVTVGKTVQLTVKNTKSKVKWSTSNKKIATVTSKGLVKGKKVGTATVTAKVGKKSFKCKVTVKVGLNRTKETLYIGDTSQLKLSGTGQKVKWYTSKKSVATVTSKGKVTAKKSGTAIITTKLGKKSYKCKVTVKNIMETPKSLSIQNAESFEVFVSKGKLYAKSADSSIVSVKVNDWNFGMYGIVVYGHKSGTTYLTLTNSYDSHKVTIKITVKKPADSGYQRVVDAIIKDGIWDAEEGAKYIGISRTSELGKYEARIYYALDSANCLIFQAADSTEDELEGEGAMMDLYASPAGGKVEMLAMASKVAESEEDIEDAKMFLATAKLPIATYDGVSDVKFDVNMSIGYTEDIQAKSNAVVQRSLKEWEDILQKKVGIGLKELGFVSLWPEPQ